MRQKPLNSLVLLTDEQDGLALGCAGHRFIKTPHLDALAARGTRFTQATTPSPICVPARAALATGRWVHQIAHWDNAMGYDGNIPGWGHSLQAAGHCVESIGKLHYVNADVPTGFDRQLSPLHLADGIGQVWGSVRNPLPDTPRPSRLFTELGSGLSKYNRYDIASATCAAQWLHSKALEKDPAPWTLFVGFVAPHFPLVVPQPYLDQINLSAIPSPRLSPQEGYTRHPWVQAHADFSNADDELGTPERRRLALACYYALTSFIDEQIGKVLSALRQSGLENATRVIVSSDHGDNQGVRGMWNKSTLYREATHIPLILAGPGIPAGKVCQTPTSLVDIAPTLLATAQLPADLSLPGKSLIEIANEQDDPMRLGFSEYHAVGSPSAAYLVRQGRWVYHHYVGYEPELFDLAADPGQEHDLAKGNRHKREIDRMESVLRTMLDPVAVDLRAKADQDRLVARFGGREAALHLGPLGASPVPQ
jgi:choline-sulfatase